MTKPTITECIQAVAVASRYSVDELTGHTRAGGVVPIRHLAMKLAREQTERSFPVLARAFKKRAHDSVLRGVRKANDLLEDPFYAEIYRRAKEAVCTVPVDFAPVTDARKSRIRRDYLDGKHVGAIMAAHGVSQAEVFAAAAKQ